MKPDKLPALSEKDFMRQIIEFAQLRGWLVHHVFEQASYARRSSKGFPDLVLVRVNLNFTGGMVIFAEIKSEKGKLTPEQTQWIETLRATPNEVFVWRPSDFDSGLIEKVLE